VRSARPAPNNVSGQQSGSRSVRDDRSRASSRVEHDGRHLRARAPLGQPSAGPQRPTESSRICVSLAERLVAGETWRDDGFVFFAASDARVAWPGQAPARERLRRDFIFGSARTGPAPSSRWRVCATLMKPASRSVSCQRIRAVAPRRGT
jgi:hypothetical protein